MFKRKEKIDKIREVKNIQGRSLTDSYQVGLYNGIELALAILEDRDAEYQTVIPDLKEQAEEQKETKGRTVATGVRKL